jgi:hypothetical protein
LLWAGLDGRVVTRFGNSVTFAAFGIDAIYTPTGSPR